MKKMIIGLFAAILMSAGLVSFAGTSAQAACPYTGCVATTTKVSAPNSVKKGAKVTVSVKIASGNAKPTGKVTVTIKKKGFSFSKTVNYTGSKVSVTSSKLKKSGTYKVSVSFSPKAGTVYKGSKASDSVKVK